jgi:2-keto-4-pentenoate hydratase
MTTASSLAAARRSGLPIAFDPATGPRDEDGAYAMQRASNLILAETLGPVAGHKIGCTTAVMQKFLGITSPAAGEMFASTIHTSHAVLRAAAFRKVGIECEIAVRIGVDVAPDVPVTDPRDVIDAVLASAEIVDDRYADYKTIGVNWLIADNFFNAGAVVAAAVAAWRSLDLAALHGRTVINGQEVGTGSGASVMGHPFHALSWLIARRQRSGLGLQAGAICLLGSVVETKWLAAGDHALIEIAGLGEVEIEVTA